MAKEYKTTKRLLSVLLDINDSPKTVESLSNRHGVTEKVIYEYIEWFKERFDSLDATNKRYNVVLSEEEVQAYNIVVNPPFIDLLASHSKTIDGFLKSDSPSFMDDSIIKSYSNTPIPNQNYSHSEFKSLLDELLDYPPTTSFRG